MPLPKFQNKSVNLCIILVRFLQLVLCFDYIHFLESFIAEDFIRADKSSYLSKFLTLFFDFISYYFSETLTEAARTRKICK